MILYSESPNQLENFLSLSIHVESLENLINVFWVNFGVFKIEDFKKLANSSISKRLNIVPEMLASI